MAGYHYYITELKNKYFYKLIIYHKIYVKYKYNYYGSVVHKVVPEVDSGEIVSECKRFNTITSLDQAFNNLRSTSLTAWIDFLQTDSIITV